MLTEGKYRYSCSLSSDSTLDGGLVVNATPQPLYPQERDPVPIVLLVVGDPRPVYKYV
jgi:hypothetical protein